MTIGKQIAEALKPAVDLVFPPRCPLCGVSIADQTGLCMECWSQLVFPSDPSCATCQRPLNSGFLESQLSPDGAAQCAPCMAAPPVHDGVAAATVYTDPSRQLVLNFKHGKRITLSKLMAKLMEARLLMVEGPALEGAWVFVPVPLHWTRLWSRGFNQSALLAQRLAKATGHNLLIDGLTRTRRTVPLGGLGRKERKKMLDGAIAVTRKRQSAIKGAQIILVDDVLTSGATSDAAVRALKKAGAKKVIISCFSRVVGEHERMNKNSKTPGT